MAEHIKRKIKELKLHPRNPRTIKDDDFERLCDSVRDNPEYFEARPLILSNRTGDLIIIAGNMRFRAAKEIGLKEVPTILLEGLTEAKEGEIMIRDNISNGKWDFETLANDFEASDLENFGLDLSAFDFKLPSFEEETVKDKNKAVKHVCPSCGHEWSGSPR